MRLGASYMSHHNPRHIETDLREMRALGMDDVLVAIQENDFTYFTGKLSFTPRIAKDLGIRPLAIFWGALNLFGGGRSSQFLLSHLDCFQVDRNGEPTPEGCYVNPLCVTRIKEMLDEAAAKGFEGYFVDEPTPLRGCFCPSCRAQYAAWYGGELISAGPDQAEAFRQRCVIEYVAEIAGHCKKHHPALETMCCLMPHDDAMWEAAAQLSTLDNLGTDIYWVNSDQSLVEMGPLVDDLAGVCKRHGKKHHEWLQCWHVIKGRENRIFEQGEILVKKQPDALYAWAWRGQVGTSETCQNPEAAWSAVERVFALAQER